MLYKIIFDDSSVFAGGTLQNSKWNEMPSKKIQSLEYYIWEEKTFVLKGFEEYNHLIERVCFMNNHQVINKIILLGRNKLDTTKIIIDILKRKYSISYEEFNKEYNNKATTGWKAGVKDSISRFYLK